MAAGQGAESVFLVHVRDRIIPLRREQIAYCYTANEKVTACTYDGTVYQLDKTLEALQGILPDADFFRANRQFIVARRAVKEIAVWFGSRLSLRLAVETPSGLSCRRPAPPNSRRGCGRSGLRISRFTPGKYRLARSSASGFSFWCYLCIGCRTDGCRNPSNVQ